MFGVGSHPASTEARSRGQSHRHACKDCHSLHGDAGADVHGGEHVIGPRRSAERGRPSPAAEQLTETPAETLTATRTQATSGTAPPTVHRLRSTVRYAWSVVRGLPHCPSTNVPQLVGSDSRRVPGLEIMDCQVDLPATSLSDSDSANP